MMDKWICANCESENNMSAEYCAFCGAKRIETAASAQQPNNTTNTSFLKGQSALNGTTSNRPVGTYTNGYTAQPRTGRASDPSADVLRAQIKKYDTMKIIFKSLVVFFTLLQLILFAVSYIKGNDRFTIFKNCAGKNGSIEQICSIVLVCITVVPAIFTWLPLNVRKRNLPVTVSIGVAVLTTIYCIVILQSKNVNIVPVFIIMCAAACVLFAVLTVRTMNQLDNAMYRPTGF